MNTKSSLAAELRDKQYRDAFVASQIRVGLPMQCRALRESQEWTQPKLAEAAGMSQPRISEIERPGQRKLNLDTLLRLASAFDVALQVRFVPFSQLVDDDNEVNFADFHIAPFEEDIAALERHEEKMKSVIVMGAHKAAGGEGGQQTPTLIEQPKEFTQPVSRGAAEAQRQSLTSEPETPKEVIDCGTSERRAG